TFGATTSISPTTIPGSPVSRHTATSSSQSGRSLRSRYSASNFSTISSSAETARTASRRTEISKGSKAVMSTSSTTDSSPTNRGAADEDKGRRDRPRGREICCYDRQDAPQKRLRRRGPQLRGGSAHTAQRVLFGRRGV